MWFGFDWPSEGRSPSPLVTFFPMLVNTLAGLYPLLGTWSAT